MKVAYISPTYFDGSSVLGGGERYSMELARCMSGIADTTLVSFFSKRKSFKDGNLKIELYPFKHSFRGNVANPASFRYLKAIFNADIVHIHQINTMVSDIGCLSAFLLGKSVFITDHGGGGSLVLNRKLPVLRCYRNAIAQSRYALDALPAALRWKAVLIKGGINTDRFCPGTSVKRERTILYVGRILPHKGINYLIEAFRLISSADYKLKIIGEVYSEQFYKYLVSQAGGLRVEFIHDADDRTLINEYRAATITVLPSVQTTCYGVRCPAPELIGMSLLESQACGTPVICTDAGAMHEFVENGKTGLVVKQGSGESLAAALRRMLDLSPPDYSRYENRCREWVRPFDWSVVAKKHLEVYKGTFRHDSGVLS
jgi:glycosyltransferase involved in cell wall biosynthesis